MSRPDWAEHDVVWLGVRSRPGSEVATWLDYSKSQAWRPVFGVAREGTGIWCRDIKLMSRPDSGCIMEFGVATSS